MEEGPLTSPQPSLISQLVISTQYEFSALGSPFHPFFCLFACTIITFLIPQIVPYSQLQHQFNQEYHNVTAQKLQNDMKTVILLSFTTLPTPTNQLTPPTFRKSSNTPYCFYYTLL
jgi:hypothetical protein